MLINAYDMVIRRSHGQQANDKNHGKLGVTTFYT
jgi:hypothetical protein